MQFLRDIAKKILPARSIDWYRRRRAVRGYLKALGFELYQRQTKLDLEELEGQIAARRDGFYERLVKDVLDRTELILQELDRRIEGVSARHGNELRALRADVEALRSDAERLRSRARAGETLGASPSDAVTVPPAAQR